MSNNATDLFKQHHQEILVDKFQLTLFCLRTGNQLLIS